MKALTKLLLSTLFTAAAFGKVQAQQAVKGSVGSPGGPLESATVSLHRAADSSIVLQAASNKAGQFQFAAVSAGRYLVSATSVGFQQAWSAPFSVGSAAVTIDKIVLQPAATQLEGVVVTNRKPEIEQKIDRMVVNVDASPTNAGLTALEVLEKTPGISVDKDGNISLKGKSGVMVLVDGKPTYLSNADVTNMLRSMPSTQLEQLEIMTNPPAKYDAAGNAGIINIKTKKNKARGFNGNFNVGAGMGRFAKSNNSLNMNYRHNKVNLFANYNYSYNKNFQELDLERRFTNQATGALVSTFDQFTYMEREFQNHNLKLGMDFYASKKTTFGAVVTGFYNPGVHESDGETWIRNPQGEVETRMHALSTFDSKWKNLGVNLNFRHQFDSTGREISADADFLGYANRNNQSVSSYFYDKFGQPNAETEILSGNLPSDINIYTLKVDYVHPVSKTLKLEAGAKSSYVNTDNNAVYRNFINGEWEIDLGRTNHFQYRENINAVYVNSSKQFNTKWSGQLGLRMEHTHAVGDQITTGEKFDRNYAQLFPTAFVSYTPGKTHQYAISYGRRIQRPNYQSMNPFYFFLDKYTFEVGNPYLRPQFSHNIDLTHTFKGFLTTTLNYTRTTDIINQVLEQDDATNTTYVKQGNIAQQQQIGLSISAGMPVTKWWRANLYMNGFYNEFKGPINDIEVKLAAPGFLMNMQNSFTLPKGWSAELSGFFRSRMIEGVFTAYAMGMVNMGVSKQILDKKGTLRLNLRDPLNLQMFRGASKYGNVDVDIRNRWDNRVVNLSFAYKFGKPIQGQQQRRRNSGASDEQNRVNLGNN